MNHHEPFFFAAEQTEFRKLWKKNELQPVLEAAQSAAQR